MLKHLPEPSLSVRLSDGDEQAFREVFDRFHRKLYQFSFGFLKEKSLSEEIVQDTFLQFWLHRESLDPNRAIAPLLFTIARRNLIDAWRKAATSADFKKKVQGFMELSTNDIDDKMLEADLERITNEALAQLTDHQHQVFTLSRYEGLSYDEIADRLQISRSTVKYHLVNALKVLRSHFIKHDVLYFYFIYFVFS